jgi:hypothetical protein
MDGSEQEEMNGWRVHVVMYEKMEPLLADQ